MRKEDNKTDLDFDDEDDESITTDHLLDEEEDLSDIEGVDLTDVSASVKKTYSWIAVVLLATSAAAGYFLYRGIRDVNHDADENFALRADDLVAAIEASFRDYDRATLLTHDRCRRERNTTREEFYEFYRYLLAGGMEFQSVQCAPNVTHEQRAYYEEESIDYYSKYYPEANYAGFTGFEYDPVTDGPVFVNDAVVAPVYFPVYYAEPVMPNAGALGLDMYSYPSQKNEIDAAVQTRQIIISKRLQVVQEIDDGAYSVILYHPGTYLETSPDEFPKDLGVILVRIPSLLSRVALIQEESLAVYLYDTTVFNTGGPSEFLGAMEYHVDRSSAAPVTKYEQIPEIDIDALRASHDSRWLYEVEVPIASGTWRVVVAPVNDSHDPDFSFVIFGGVMIIVAGLGLAFFLYINSSKMKEIYRAKAEAEAERELISSLFPKTVVARLMADAKAKQAAKKDKAKLVTNWVNPKRNSKSGASLIPRAGLVLPAELTSEGLFGSKPIAEFHPHVTIMSADITGFTAWSSVREPSQVFTLLEVLYFSFDEIGKRRRVFKVETIGDMYIAAAGVPSERNQHAVVMARFSIDCLRKFHVIAQELETSLGPDTGDLDIRIGLHSGPVTAGVLRGEKGRFQLFGNTFNQSQSIVKTSLPSKIQVSAETAGILSAAGRAGWLKPREDKVVLRGVGHAETFWLKADSGKGTSVVSSSCRSNDIGTKPRMMDAKSEKKILAKTDRLVRWNVAELSELLKKVLAARASKIGSVEEKSNHSGAEPYHAHDGRIPLDLVKDVIAIPEFNPKAAIAKVSPEDIKLEDEVVNQLEEFVRAVAALYRPNPFHNFEHASHVAMSITKQLTRISNPKNLKNDASDEQTNLLALHNSTYGISDDPMTQFTAFVVALIHDADHPGFPNSVLAVQDPLMNDRYKGLSLAEQNSLDLCWDLLNQDKFTKFRNCIFSDQEERTHFRELLVNMTLATDVMDKELGAQRKERWNKAFTDSSVATSELENRNRKATIILEHLIQASDVSHTMQHWHVYLKWNERLFLEMYHAYKQGFIPEDPSKAWYQGELGFLTYYVLPLASKLDTCGVFGVSSDEFRFYATENLKEWELKGQDLVKEYIEKYNSSHLCGGANQSSMAAAGIQEGQNEGTGRDDSSTYSV